MLEIDDDWEPFVRISISNQSFLALCDIGSKVSTMPKIVYDSLKLDMDKLSSYHEHSNGGISGIKGKVKEVQVAFLHRKGKRTFYKSYYLPTRGRVSGPGVSVWKYS